ncbi:MAG: TRAP transporter small permease subunit [Paracoccus sp. (in: a-proteobacteria)]|nr:TRAP transporter small permease subunit [Paracoccus sp. (in: a-proteobacteria)]
MIRPLLDRIYNAALFASCAAMVAIALMVLFQVLGRVIDRGVMMAGGARIGLAIPSLAEIAGALFVASATLALPATLKQARHVRVSFASRIGGVPGRVILIAMMLAAIALAGFATWHMAMLAMDSWQYNSVSYGRVKIPLWLPQTAMAVGFGLLLVALIDEVVLALSGHAPAFRIAEDARAGDDIHE